MNTPRDRQNVKAVLQVSVKANDELYREIRRDANMCDALRELMKDDLCLLYTSDAADDQSRV